jgi:uncharacterized coiled-coil protein SlyX
MKKIILKALTSFIMAHNDSTNRAPLPRRWFLIPAMLVFFAFLPRVQATPEEGPAVPKTSQQAPATPEILEGTPAAPNIALPGFNTADGDHALFSVSTGSANSAFGWYSLFSNTDGSFNTGVGAGTLLSNTANNNTAVGGAALLFNTTASNNTAVGVVALENNTTGGNNTANGAFALSNNIDGVEHTAIGSQALANNTTANDNTAVGLLAMSSNVDGGSNTAVGAAALRDNVSGTNNQAFGRGALRFSTGSNNIAIGREAGANMTTADNVISIGSPGDGTAFATSDRCFIGNIRGVTVGNGDGISVIVDSDGQLGTTNSSRRFKKDIEPMNQTSEAILALKPVTFHYKNQDTKKAESTPHFGLIAEDVAEVNPNLVVRDADGKPFTVRYDAVNAMLLNEFLKEHKKVEEQQINITQLNSNLANQAAVIARQQKGMEILTAQIKEQAVQIQKVSAELEISKPAAQVANYEQ